MATTISSATIPPIVSQERDSTGATASPGSDDGWIGRDEAHGAHGHLVAAFRIKTDSRTDQLGNTIELLLRPRVEDALVVRHPVHRNGDRQPSHFTRLPHPLAARGADLVVDGLPIARVGRGVLPQLLLPVVAAAWVCSG